MWQVLLLMPAFIILYSLSKAQLDFVELGKAVASSSGILFHCFIVYACNYFLTFKFLLKTEFYRAGEASCIFDENIVDIVHCIVKAFLI